MPDKTASTETPLPSQARSSLWRDRNFLLLWGGGAASDLGSAVSVLLIPLLAVQELGATTFQVALLVLSRRLPAVVISLPAGVLVDRMCKRRLMIWCETLSLLAVGSIPLFSIFAHVALWQLYLVTALTGTLGVFFGIADMSYLPAMLPRDVLVDANGKLNATESAADAAGPAVGALLAGLVTAARAIAVDAISYAISAVTLLLIRTPEPRPDAGRVSGVGFREAMTKGVRYVWKDPSLRAITCCSATANLGINCVVSLEVVYLVRELRVSSALVGVVIGTGVVGGFLGGLFARRLGERIGTVRLMWVSLLVCAPFALLMPLAMPGVGLVLYPVGWAMFNFGGAVHQTLQMSYRQMAVPADIMGRVNASIRWIVWSAVPLGALLGGSVGTWFGLRDAFWVAGALLASTSLWLLASPLRRLRDIPVAQAP